jgi:hypothetical protein
LWSVESIEYPLNANYREAKRATTNAVSAGIFYFAQQLNFGIVQS